VQSSFGPVTLKDAACTWADCQPGVCDSSDEEVWQCCLQRSCEAHAEKTAIMTASLHGSLLVLDTHAATGLDLQQ
jgi:hypothetical protein